MTTFNQISEAMKAYKLQHQGDKDRRRRLMMGMIDAPEPLSVDDGDFDDDLETHERRETLTAKECI